MSKRSRFCASFSTLARADNEGDKEFHISASARFVIPLPKKQNYLVRASDLSWELATKSTKLAEPAPETDQWPASYTDKPLMADSRPPLDAFNQSLDGRDVN